MKIQKYLLPIFSEIVVIGGAKIYTVISKMKIEQTIGGARHDTGTRIFESSKRIL
jgi:hypothetical protein